MVVSCFNHLLYIGRTVRTSFNNTSFNMTYGIRLTCFDDKAGSAIDDTTGEAMIKVTFVDAGSMDSCAETTVTTPTTMSTMSTMSNQGVIQQKECVGFFQSPVNIALLAFFGGVFVGIPSGVVIYLAAKRYACKSSAVGNGVK